MATTKGSRRTKHPIKLKDLVAEHFVAESTTPQQMSIAVKRKLSQVESLIKDLTKTSFNAEQPTVKDRVTKDLRNRDLQLELDLLAPNSSCCSYSESPRNGVRLRWSRRPQQQHLMVILSQKKTLKSLQQDPVVQSELKSLMDSSRDPILLGLTEEEQDPAQPLFKPFASRNKRPLLIPNFISSLPSALHEVKETVLGTSTDARIKNRSGQETLS